MNGNNHRLSTGTAPIPINCRKNSNNSSSSSARSAGSGGTSPQPPSSLHQQQQQQLASPSVSAGLPHGRRRALSVSMVSSTTVDYLAEQMADPQATISRALRSRNGAVLAKRTILKRDHFQRAFQQLQYPLENNNGNSGGSSWSSKVLWFNTREEPVIYISGMPFVLRDSESPKQNIRTYAGISADRLEQMESRLKDDVLKECHRFNGLVLIHDELDSGEIVPTWCAASQVQTTRDLFESFATDGYQVLYNRIPISPEQRPDDKYLDEYVRIIRASQATDALVFNCGLGVGRTTFALVAALLIRRAQLISSGHNDPYTIDRVRPEMVYNEQTTMLRLVYVLERGLKSKMSPHSAIEWALARSTLIDSLRNAIMGNYQTILSLASVLENGQSDKRLLDIVINRCDAMVNLREEILINRVRHTIDNTGSHLERAHGFLERYFFLLCFAAYANETLSPSSELLPEAFSQWMINRPEIGNMLSGFRKRGPDLLLFRPVEDLSVFSNVINPKAAPGDANELENLVIKNRNGTVLVSQTILKVDMWSSEIAQRSEVTGAPNFRQVNNLPIFAVAQPTRDGLFNVLSGVKRKQIVWINLREEPLIYIYGSPYVLRDRYFTLRNIKSYVGITAHRLELLETRLKDDVIKELESYDEKILLHEESSYETVVPVWTSVQPNNILTLKELMESMKERLQLDLAYYRVPLTAESAPEPTDFDEILRIISQYNSKNTSFVLNCQIGMGRSTTGTVITIMVVGWLQGATLVHEAPSPAELPRQDRLQYRIIHSLLRILRNSLEIKQKVDDIIDACSSKMNLRQNIEHWRAKAASEVDPERKSTAVRRAAQSLRRYFLLIAFQAYLGQNPPDSLRKLISFEQWMKNHPEFETLFMELDHSMDSAIIPVDELLPGDGVALTSEVLSVVKSRSGSVLAQNMILKYDHFPGCQKLSLAERVDGAPNYRRLDIDNLFQKNAYLFSPRLQRRAHGNIFGVAMPVKDAIGQVLRKIDPTGKRKILWTSLREEPVIYVNGKPYVLRSFQDPLKNLEATGIVRERVESMESRMKTDAIEELRRYGGRLLLHGEESDGTSFTVTPIWESLLETEIQTPHEVFESIRLQGFNVDYLRIPITDEQAPIPQVFDLLHGQVGRLAGDVNAIFNCQMGRGRTTTGMVIACVVEMIRHGISRTEISPSNQTAIQSSPLQEGETADDADESERERYLNGEYRIVLQLMRVLAFGKLSKLVVDEAIDACSHVQNIRAAIYDFKLRVDAAVDGKKLGLLAIGMNYLFRYFYLIVFASYVLEREEKPKSELPFTDWLAERREITNVVHTAPRELV